MVDQIFYGIGVVVVIGFGTLAVMFLFACAVEYVIGHYLEVNKLRKEFIQWYGEKLKNENN